MNIDQYANEPHGTSHPPSCGCCLAYQAAKMREKVRKILVTIQNHVATLERSPTKSKFNGIVLRLADLCIQYEEVENVLIRTAESGASSELQEGAVKLAGTITAKAGKKLECLINEVSDLFAEQRSKGA